MYKARQILPVIVALFVVTENFIIQKGEEETLSRLFCLKMSDWSSWWELLLLEVILGAGCAGHISRQIALDK